MKKKTRQRMTNLDPGRQRRLDLSRETVRTLSPDQLTRAVGGSACDTGSYPTDKKITSHR
jgi:hypothetical protein